MCCMRKIIKFVWREGNIGDYFCLGVVRFEIWSRGKIEVIGI